MRLGVVIPTLDEEAELGATLDALLAQSPDEIVVVDGGSTDGTRAVAGSRVRWLHSPRGRARQLNAGASALGPTDALLFLHADCILGSGSLEAIRGALQDPAVVGGGFHKRFLSPHPLVRHGVRARTKLWHASGYVLGDQAQFVRTRVFWELGGLRQDVAAEDMDFAWRLGFAGRVELLEPEACVSGRRFEREGVVSTWARWWSIALRQGTSGAWEGPCQGALAGSISLEPRACRDSSSTG